MILRDRDANEPWTSASDGALEERRFYCQNWRADVVAVMLSDGAPMAQAPTPENRWLGDGYFECRIERPLPSQG